VTGRRDADWKASWVRPGPANPGADEYTYVRKVVPLRNNPIVEARAFVAASQQFQLYVGRKRAGAGPAYSYPDRSYYQTFDLTHLLRPGKPNVIGVLHYWSGAGQGRPAGIPGLLVQVQVEHANGAHEVFGTDGTWREHAAEWLDAPRRNDEGGFVERIDARRYPDDWTSANFDDATWRRVAVIGPPGTKPFTHLVAQRTRIRNQLVSPVSVKTLPDGAVVADYGAVIAASPNVLFKQGVAGRTVAMHVGFALDADGHVSTTASTQATDLSFEYVQRDGSQVFDPFTYLGFRYLEIADPGEPLKAAQLGAHARHTKMPDEDAATFRSSDKTLDKVWKLLRHSALYASQDQFVDTPTREKGQFLADAYNISQATMRAFGEQNLTWQALHDFADSQRRFWPNGNLNAVYPNGDGPRSFLDFTERYPDWVWQYYLQTGDRDTLEELYPVVHRVGDYVASLIDADTGLVTYTAADGADLVDWPPAMQYGYDVATAAHTTANALAALDFERVAQIASVLGRDDDASAARKARDALVAAINRRLTRPDGVYVDGLRADGTQSAHAAQQANAFALVCGVVPRSKIAHVGSYVAGLGIRTGPMDGLFLLDALRVAGRTGDVLRILTDTRQPGWAYETAHGGTFTWESWLPSDVEGDSLSHGWGSSALVAFQTALLGVTIEPMSTPPSGPVVSIVDPGAGPGSVEGTISTVAGPLSVHWERSGEHVKLYLRVPPNATAHVEVGGRARVVGAGLHAFTA
jgi:alpha-L-rhamnosidase